MGSEDDRRRADPGSAGPLRRRSRARAIWAARASCLGLITGLASSLAAWGIKHHEGQVIFEAAGVVILALVVILLNWRLDD